MKAPYSRTLFDLLREQAERFPEHIAVICGEREATYRDLADGAGRIGAALRAYGIGRGDRVGILINNRLEWLETCFGAAALGAVAVPFSTWSKPGELAYLLVDSAVEALFAVASFGGQDFAAALAALVPEAITAMPGDWRSRDFPRLRLIVMLGGDVQPGWIAYERFCAAALPMDALAAGEGASAVDDALILYTSGSSARPKAVRLQHFAVIENGFNIGERMGLRANDRVLLAPPLFWAYGACNALPATLSHGAALVLQGRFDAGEWIGLVERHRCTAAYTLPSITGAVLRHAAFGPERVSCLRTGLMIGSSEEVRIAAVELGSFSASWEAFDSGLTLNPIMIALEAVASITSDSLIPPTEVCITLTLTSGWVIFSKASLIASTEPCTSPLIIMFNSLICPSFIFM